MRTTSAGYVLVFLGAGIGGMLRHAINRLALTSSGTFPWSTFVVNVSGSLAMGMIAGWFAFRSHASEQMTALFLTTGVLGGYTTFSAFSLDAVLLWERGNVTGAIAYAAGTVAISTIALVTGLSLVRP